jgi:eukaryotic-like serine/threonine-protein kinase
MNHGLGRYRLLERIGDGAMAEVFKAKSYGVEGFEKVVAIKRILPELASSQTFLDLFVREAKLAVSLSHANIVQVFDLGIIEDSPAEGSRAMPSYYMVLEYVNGQDLGSLLAQARRMQLPLPYELCAYVAAEVAKGLDHAHRRCDAQMQPLEIVHRDVSPKNILLSVEGEVKLTDFGIARARGMLDPPNNLEATHLRKLQGKFSYMSPEQARGESATATSDVFSLGAVLYECVVGMSPFAGPTTFETLRRAQHCEYPPVQLGRPGCPSTLRTIIETSMASEPSQRFSSASSMHESLLELQFTERHRFSSLNLARFIANALKRATPLA